MKIIRRRKEGRVKELEINSTIGTSKEQVFFYTL
jgi:hypothetical protein